MTDTQTPPHKPIPVPDQLSESFWSGAIRGQLVIQRCVECHTFAHPPVPVCSRCGSDGFTYEAVSGRGRIDTFTLTRQARNPAFGEDPYFVAWVELVEQPGLRLICNLPGADQDRVRIGTDVEVWFETIAPDVRLPQFRLV